MTIQGRHRRERGEGEERELDRDRQTDIQGETERERMQSYFLSKEQSCRLQNKYQLYLQPSRVAIGNAMPKDWG